MIESLSSLESTSRLRESGFEDKHLVDLSLPNIETVDAPDGSTVVFQVFGDRIAAKTLVFSSIAYSTRLLDSTEQVHLAVQQAVLGEGYCLVGVQAYEPGIARFKRTDRKTVASGSFRPLADRTLLVIETLNPSDGQQVALHGFSMGADVSVEATYQNLFDVNRGIRQIDRLGAYEMARTKNQGRLAMASTFATSGPDLFFNILWSNSPALLEARNINLEDSKAEKKHEKWVRNGVVKYNIQDPLGNLAFMNGFGHDTSIVQMNQIATHLDRPKSVVGRAENSIVFTRKALALIAEDPQLSKVEFISDHSAGDDLRVVGAMALRTVAA